MYRTVAAARENMSDLPANSTAQNAKRILIVEDDPIVARIYQNRLTNAGFSVSVSAEGGDGFFCIVKDKPDAVLLDLMLPHMDGLQILRKTRAQKAFEKTPIIAFSNSYMNGMLQNAVEAGATMVVNKSDTGAIENIVESFLDLLCRPSGNRFVPTPAPTPPSFAEEEQVSEGSQTTQQAATSFQPAPTTFREPQATTRPAPAAPAQRPRFGVAPVGRPRPGAPTPPQRPSAVAASNTQPACAASPSESQTSVDRPSAPRSAEQSLLEIFADKGAETMARIRTILRSYTKDPSSPDGRNHLQDLYRLVHCLTSVAGMASLESTANFSACLEALLHELLTKPGSFQPSTLRTLASAVDVLGCMFQQAGRYECPLMTEAFVLVVDDDVISQRTVTLSLQKARLGVVCASDYQEALSKLKEIAFELIALDVNLPGGDGFDLCTNIRRIPSYEKIPILFVTGLNDFHSRAKSIAAGGNDFISKPLSRIEMTVRSLSYVMKGRLPITREAPQHVLV